MVGDGPDNGTHTDTTVVYLYGDECVFHQDNAPVPAVKPVHAPVRTLGGRRSPTHPTAAARAVRAMTRGRR